MSNSTTASSATASLSPRVCYDGSGQTSSDYACDPYAETSACCGAGSQCIDNLHCIDPYGDPVPGSCTDQAWGSEANLNPFCPCRARYVGDTPLDYKDSVTFCSDGSFCCGFSDTDCCSQGKGNAIINYGQTAILPTSTALIESWYSGLHVTTEPISRSTATSATVASSSTSSSTTATPVPGSHKGLSSGAKVGIGVGVAGGVLAVLLVVGFFLLRRSRGRSQDKTLTYEPWTSLDISGLQATAAGPGMAQNLHEKDVPHHEPAHELDAISQQIVQLDSEQ